MKKKSLLNLLAALLVFIVLPILFASPAAADYTIDGMNFIDIGPTPGLFSQHGTFVNFSDMTGGQMDTLVSADPFVGGVVMGISNLSGTGSVSLILGSPSNHVVSAQCPAPVGWVAIWYNGVLGSGGEAKAWGDIGGGFFQLGPELFPNFLTAPYLIINANDTYGQSLSFQVDYWSLYVPFPLPSAILLFAPGLVGLAAIRRKFWK